VNTAHAIAARQHVLAVARRVAGGDAQVSDLRDAVALLDRAEAAVPAYTCGACGRAVIVRASGEPLRACPHVEADIVAHCSASCRVQSVVGVEAS